MFTGPTFKVRAVAVAERSGPRGRVARALLDGVVMEATMAPKTLALALAAVLAAACTTAQTSTPTLTQGEAPRGCPLGVAGATVVAEDTPDGIALSFRSKNRPEEMRERANDSAAQHGQGQHLGRGHDGGKHGDGADHGLQLMQAPPARSVAEDIEDGARIRFVAADAKDTDALRTKLRERANAMNNMTCK